MKQLSLAIALLTFAGAVNAQTLCTPLTAGNGQKGAMFDVANLSANTVFVTSVQQTFLAVGNVVYEIYTRPTTYVGGETSAATWTLVGTSAQFNATVAGAGTSFTIPMCATFSIPAGGSIGLYLTCTSATAANVAYTTGVAGNLGTTLATDGTLDIKTGLGKTYPFGTNFGLPNAGRKFNGCLTYQTTAPAPLFEGNDSLSSFDVNGVQGSACSKAVTTVCANSSATVNFASTQSGNPSESFIAFEAANPSTSPLTITSANGQIVNVNLFSPTLFWLYGGPAPSFSPFPGNFSVPFNVGPLAFVVSAQQVVLTALHPDGFALSQPGEVNVVASTVVSGPTGDDASLAIALGGSPGCGPGSVTFYTTAYTTMQVITNGRTMFGTASTSFTPTVAQSLLDAPAVGCWTDFITPGGIDIDMTVAGMVSVRYNGIGYFAQAGTASTFQIVFDTTTGNVTLANINTLGAQIGALNMWTGMSPGGGTATNPGAQPFAPAGSGAAGLATDALYIFGLAPQNGGCNNIIFTPAGANYAWTAN